ncbi:MAG: putative hemolysin [Anaerolineae bacterium]
MKKTLTITILLLVALTACTPRQAQVLEPTATYTPQANMPNPASVYCGQQGNSLEIRAAADGAQTGVCVFPDGSECEEWAYFRGECGPAEPAVPTLTAAVETATPTGRDEPGSSVPPETAEAVDGWWGIIVSTPAGAQFDDAFERRDLGQVIVFGVDSLDPAVHEQIVALRDSGKIVHLWGTLLSNVPDVNGSQVQVERIEVSDAAGGYMPPGTAEEFADWWGIIVSTPAGAQFDDAFERRDLGQVIVFGIDSLDPAVHEQIVALRDTGEIVHLWGTLLSNVPDVNGSQVQVERVVVEE